MTDTLTLAKQAHIGDSHGYIIANELEHLETFRAMCVAERDKELLAVGMEPVAEITADQEGYAFIKWHDEEPTFYKDHPIGTKFHTATQLAAARLQGQEEGRAKHGQKTGKFQLNDRVRKIPRPNAGEWQGRVVGTYSTSRTPEGYAVESEREPGSVQIYPVGALELMPENN